MDHPIIFCEKCGRPEPKLIVLTEQTVTKDLRVGGAYCRYCIDTESSCANCGVIITEEMTSYVIFHRRRGEFESCLVCGVCRSNNAKHGTGYPGIPVN